MASVILKTDALGDGWAGIKAVEILDGCDDGIGGVVGEDGDPEGQARTILGGIGEHELKGDMFGDG